METKVVNSKEYYAYRNIKARCFNEKNKDYKNYGGRGITMCDGWALSYSKFLRDVGTSPSKAHTIERINNNGHYQPGNVRWATRSEQVKNRRNSINLTYLCHTRSLTEWCSIFKVKYNHIHRFIKRKKVNDLGLWMSMRFGQTFKPAHPSKIRIDKTTNRAKYYHDLDAVLIKYGLKQ